MDAKQRLHPLDRLIADDSLFLLEAMVPFVDYPFKKPLVLFIKYRELMSILRCLDDKPYIESCGFDYHPDNTEDMISHMCNFLPGNFASSIKQMKQMMHMMEVMNMAGGPNMPDMADLSGAADLSGMTNVPDAPNMPDMADLSGATDLSGMANMTDVPDLPDMTNLSGVTDPVKMMNFGHKASGRQENSLYESVLSILENESKE